MDPNYIKSSNDSSDLEKEILKLLDTLPMEVGIPSNIKELLRQAGQPFMMEIGRNFLTSVEARKRSLGKK